MSVYTESRRAKNRLYDSLATVSAAFGSPRRLELIDVLAQGPRSVEGLAAEAEMSLANTSQHLQRLKRAGLTIDERAGTSVVYRLADAEIAKLWLRLRDLAATRSAQVGRALDAYRPQRRCFQTVALDAALAAVQSGEATLIDVRPPEEYGAAHLPGAINVPPDRVDGWAAQTPARQPVIAYCRGPYCRFADDALSILTERGVSVARLEAGVLEWQAESAQEEQADPRPSVG